jgi:hypothetical protein
MIALRENPLGFSTVWINLAKSLEFSLENSAAMNYNHCCLLCRHVLLFIRQ